MNTLSQLSSATQCSVLIRYNRLIDTLRCTKLLYHDGLVACVHTLQSMITGSNHDDVALFPPNFSLCQTFFPFTSYRCSTNSDQLMNYSWIHTLLTLLTQASFTSRGNVFSNPKHLFSYSICTYIYIYIYIYSTLDIFTMIFLGTWPVRIFHGCYFTLYCTSSLP